ncbi:CHAT domain-containing protein [Kitasatospora sp. NPDC097691]|uniref:CHAT domain-containing protein n=1 Tax=Kitasatospora sp. NPDC097691 TaxID=3157231 RepID=UPI00331AD685
MISSRPLAVFDMESTRRNVVLTIGGCDLDLGPRARLTAAREKVDFILARFREGLSYPTPTLAELSRGIAQLDDAMGQIAYLLVDDNVGLLDEVRTRLVSAWPQWQVPTDVIPLIEIRGHDEDFPFELLPLFDARPVPAFVNYAEAEDTLRRFLGFGAVVRRTRGETAEVEDLRASPRLPVQLLSHSGVHTEADTESLEGHDGVDIEGPWPGPGIPLETVVERLVDALYDPGTALDGGSRSSPVQIQHFSCHCTTDNRTDEGFTLILGGSGDHERRISLGRIRQGFRQRAQQRGPLGGARSLVIANACGSAKIDKTTRRSFPHWFLRNRHRGFIGTETDVPEEVAVAFSVRLYEALLDQKPLGEAVVLARRRLFTDRSNPLGLLYVLYGDPFLRIR